MLDDLCKVPGEVNDEVRPISPLAGSSVIFHYTVLHLTHISMEFYNL